MDPLPLVELKPWVSADTYEWLRNYDAEQAAFRRQCEEENPAPHLFATDDDSDDDDGAERVQCWTSSPTRPDGVGGFQEREDAADGAPRDDEGADRRDAVSVLFILSESYDGFGDTLWSSARHVANLMADPARCREAFGWPEEGAPATRHPLSGRSFVELGAGGGVPSWTAVRCGARAVSTDLANPDRIRCMAECLARNHRALARRGADAERLATAALARAAPLPWGTPVEQVLALNGGARFDALVAADCCYLPWCHDDMLDTIDGLLDAERGVALVPFAMHGNTDDDDVWGIVGRAEAKGFAVERLPARQLTPPGRGMEAKQGLVHMLRLTRK